jgi:hypothetical protein
MTQGQDASEAFEEFHYRSNKAKHVLHSLPHSPLKIHHREENEMLEDFANFRKSLENRGFFTPNYFHISYRIFEIFALYILATYLANRNIIASILLFGLLGGRCGWIQHEGGHTSLTGNITRDKQIQNFFIGFMIFGDEAV